MAPAEPGSPAEEMHRAGEEARRQTRDAPRTGAFAPGETSAHERAAERSDTEVDPASSAPRPHEGIGPGIGEGPTVLEESAAPADARETPTYPSERGAPVGDPKGRPPGEV